MFCVVSSSKIRLLRCKTCTYCSYNCLSEIISILLNLICITIHLSYITFYSLGRDIQAVLSSNSWSPCSSCSNLLISHSNEIFIYFYFIIFIYQSFYFISYCSAIKYVSFLVLLLFFVCLFAIFDSVFLWILGIT